MPPLLFDVGQPLSRGFPGGPGGKESACNEGDPGLMPGLGRSPGEGNGNALRYSCLENPMDGGAWWVMVHVVSESDTTEQLHFTSGKEGARVAQVQLLGPSVTHLPYSSLSQNREGAECSNPQLKYTELQ